MSGLVRKAGVETVKESKRKKFTRGGLETIPMISGRGEPGN